MPYSDLYSYCQTLEVPISRTKIIAKAVEIAGKGPVAAVKSGLDPEKVRGLFICATNEDSKLVKQCGGKNLIVVARTLNYCWERFVTVKELMHLFDDELERASSGEEFEELIEEFATPAVDRSQQMRSEIAGLHMALSLFCPEQKRQEYERQLRSGKIDVMGVAQALKIPAQHVPRLFGPEYKRRLQTFLEPR